MREICFCNDTATTEIYTLSLHDALPISRPVARIRFAQACPELARSGGEAAFNRMTPPPRWHQKRRSEEHTSEFQSRQYLVCRLLLEKKKNSHPDPVLDHLVTHDVLHYPR